MQINDVVIVMLFFFSSVHGMYDDEFAIKRGCTPDLYCHRILEKIEYLKEDIQESKKYFTDPLAYLDHIELLKKRIERLYRKLEMYEESCTPRKGR